MHALVAPLSRLRSKHLERWLPGYARHLGRSLLRPAVRGTRHLLFAVCDHYEPLFQRPDESVARARVRIWRDRYPALAAPYRDADGRRPQHSFFYPGEEYRPELFDDLETLITGGYGEVELHLHHDGSTEAELREELLRHVETFAARGHFAREPGGRSRYAFIHGNWALANGRPDGRHCGVDAELPLLFETGCYADFTFPSLPDVSQPNMVNQIYWPRGDLRRRRSYEGGEPARVGARHDDRLLMVTGPVAVARRDGRLTPRLEYAALQAHDPASRARVDTWVRQNVHVAGRPEWTFVKVHTHGAPERQAKVLLGGGFEALHRALAEGYNDGTRWRLHYVTAREMFNIAVAAMDGKRGDPHAYRDYALPPPPLRGGPS